MKYISGRNNLACTIFVPFDCNNNCPFCTSKGMYKTMHDKFNLEKILEYIDLINYNPFIKEYVLTGGEPCANLELLKTIVNACKKPIYINTTMPLTPFVGDTIQFINECDKIKGISVSRHMSVTFKNVASPLLLSNIKKPIRINVVMTKNFNMYEFGVFVDYYSDYFKFINLRADYTKIDNKTLKNTDDVCLYLLDKHTYHGNTSCLVCNTDYFETNKHVTIAYHRGLQYSSVKLLTKTFINDVIITPDGEIHHDWNFDEEEPKDFLEWCLGCKTKNRIIVDLDNDKDIVKLLKILSDK